MKGIRALGVAASIGMLLAAVSGCRGKPAADEASIKERLEEKGTIDLMDQVSKAPDYPPPADGRLSHRQVKMYVEVRRREQKIREVAFKNLQAKGDQAEQEKREVGFFEAMKAVGDVADVATADLRAAQELGHNPKEYQWVRDQVLAAQMLQTTEALNRQVARGQRSLIDMLEEQKRQTTDEGRRAEIDRRIRELEENAGKAPDSDPAKEYNAGLLTRYKDELAALEAEDRRIAENLQQGDGQGDGR